LTLCCRERVICILDDAFDVVHASHEGRQRLLKKKKEYETKY
jgi:hypothetical protein